MNQFTLTVQARDDLDAIWAYIAVEQDREQAADRLIERFHEAFELLAHNPLIGEQQSDLYPDMRMFTVRNFVLFYRPIASDIELVRVLHGARDFGPLFP